MSTVVEARTGQPREEFVALVESAEVRVGSARVFVGSASAADASNMKNSSSMALL
jgi:hypothetical protein